MKTKRHLLLLAMLIALLAIPTFTVFAKELGLLTVAGPGIKGELSLNDHEAMLNLEKTGFFNTSAIAKVPDGLDLDMGYSMTAHLNLDGKLVPFVEMVYYPTTEGLPGYIHYTGRLEGESLRPVDEWTVMNLEADTALRDLMVSNNVAIRSALVTAAVNAESPAASAAQPVTNPEPVVAPVAASAINSAAYTTLAIGAILMLMIGAGLVIRRRTTSQSTT